MVKNRNVLGGIQKLIARAKIIRDEIKTLSFARKLFPPTVS